MSCSQGIEKRFRGTSVEMLAQLLKRECDLPRKTLEVAKRLVEDVRLHVWVSKQNSTQGVAPPPQFVWERRCALVIENRGPYAEASAGRPPRSYAAKKWVQRFRRRWNLVLGRQEAKDVLPVSIMRSKVMRRSPNKHRVTHLKFILWSKCQPHFRVRLTKTLYQVR